MGNLQIERVIHPCFDVSIPHVFKELSDRGGPIMLDVGDCPPSALPKAMKYDAHQLIGLRLTSTME